MDGLSNPGRDGVVRGYSEARAELHDLLTGSSVEALKAGSLGTRWTDEQLCWWPRLHGGASAPAPGSHVQPSAAGGLHGFASILNAGTRPFDVVNYWGSRWGATVFNRNRMEAQLDRTLRALIRNLARETDDSLRCAMAFPTRWDPFFRPDHVHRRGLCVPNPTLQLSPPTTQPGRATLALIASPCRYPGSPMGSNGSTVDFIHECGWYDLQARSFQRETGGSRLPRPGSGVLRSAARSRGR